MMNLLEVSLQLTREALRKRVEVRGHLPPDLVGHAGIVFDVEETADAVIFHAAPATEVSTANPGAGYDPQSDDPRLAAARRYQQPDRSRCVRILRVGHGSARCRLAPHHAGDCQA